MTMSPAMTLTPMPITDSFHTPLTAAKTKSAATRAAVTARMVLPGRVALMSVKEAPENFLFSARSMS